MVKTLAEWIESLNDYEQFFFIWLEVCSATSIFFQKTPSPKMDFESAYRETLSFLFKSKIIDGIPSNPFFLCKKQIRNNPHGASKDAKSIKFEFVHPSYHEAFWYAIKLNKDLHDKWELLKKNVNEILKDFEYRWMQFSLARLRTIAELIGTGIKCYLFSQKVAIQMSGWQHLKVCWKTLNDSLINLNFLNVLNH